MFLRGCIYRPLLIVNVKRRKPRPSVALSCVNQPGPSAEVTGRRISLLITPEKGGGSSGHRGPAPQPGRAGPGSLGLALVLQSRPGPRRRCLGSGPTGFLEAGRVDLERGQTLGGAGGREDGRPGGFMNVNNEKLSLQRSFTQDFFSGVRITCSGKKQGSSLVRP